MSPLFETIEPRTLMSTTYLGEQKQNIEHLLSDLRAIHAKSNVTLSQIRKLGVDVYAVIQVGNKPSAESVQKLKTDTKNFWSDKIITTAERVTLAADVQGVLASANVPPALAKAVGNDLKAIYSASNITSADIKLIQSDIAAIVTTYQNRHP